MKLQKDIREFVELLLSENVEFLLVDGYTLALHGAPRFTEDIHPDGILTNAATDYGSISNVSTFSPG